MNSAMIERIVASHVMRQCTTVAPSLVETLHLLQSPMTHRRANPILNPPTHSLKRQIIESAPPVQLQMLFWKLRGFFFRTRNIFFTSFIFTLISSCRTLHLDSFSLNDTVNISPCMRGCFLPNGVLIISWLNWNDQLVQCAERSASAISAHASQCQLIM